MIHYNTILIDRTLVLLYCSHVTISSSILNNITKRKAKQDTIIRSFYLYSLLLGNEELIVLTSGECDHQQSSAFP